MERKGLKDDKRRHLIQKICPNDDPNKGENVISQHNIF